MADRIPKVAMGINQWENGILGDGGKDGIRLKLEDGTDITY